MPGLPFCVNTCMYFDQHWFCGAATQTIGKLETWGVFCLLHLVSYMCTSRHFRYSLEDCGSPKIYLSRCDMYVYVCVCVYLACKAFILITMGRILIKLSTVAPPNLVSM